MATLVLVHGAFRGPWAWDRVQPHLVGHTVLTPDLTGAGTGPVPRLADWAGTVASAVTAADPAAGPVVLVGHSQGGIAALAAASLVPDAVDQLVLLDAPVPRPGECAADVLPAEVRAAYGDPDPEAWLPPVPTGDPWVDERLVPSPVGPAYEPVDPDGRASAVPTTVVFCSRTGPGVPATWSRHRFDDEGRAYVVLDADHDAPLQQPAEVAALLRSFVAA